jgi:hypothetical protein
MGVIGVALSLAADAHAVERKGFLIGFSLGGGAYSCEDCSDTLSGPGSEIHLGGMLSPKVALMFDGGGIAGDDGGDSIYFTTSTAAAQFFVSDRVWLKGGLGLAQLSCDGCGDSETGVGVLLAAGLELVQKKKFVLDLQARATGGSFDGGNISGFAFHLGFNWY